jgi:hypothetical protein
MELMLTTAALSIAVGDTDMPAFPEEASCPSMAIAYVP